MHLFIARIYLNTDAFKRCYIVQIIEQPAAQASIASNATTQATQRLGRLDLRSAIKMVCRTKSLYCLLYEFINHHEPPDCGRNIS